MKLRPSLAWRIEFSRTSIRSLKELDKQVSKRITTYLREIAVLDDPRVRGKALTGPLAGFWRYRIGDYRIVCEIRDEQLIIYAIDIDHRSAVYRN